MVGWRLFNRLQHQHTHLLSRASQRVDRDYLINWTARGWGEVIEEELGAAEPYLKQFLFLKMLINFKILFQKYCFIYETKQLYANIEAY